MTIHVTLGGDRHAIDRRVFTALFEQSIVHGRKPYLDALTSSEISFDMLVRLARQAEIPYTLFWAPLETVEAQLRAKLDKLLAGLGKDAFSLNSRSKVELRDVELIVKDLLRKQELLKRLDGSLTPNRIVACLKGSSAGVVRDGERLRELLGFTPDDLKACKSKTAAFQYLIARLEQCSCWSPGANKISCLRTCLGASSSAACVSGIRRCHTSS